jgi:MFS superfamily sulfate permease-like transporter
MREANKKALAYSAVGMASVLVMAFLTDLLAPQNQVGQGLRFAVPVLTGIVSGAVIFLRLRQELDYMPEDIEESSE